MDTDLKTKWVAALRSGEYVQGKGSLQTQDGFCCLGVLCEVAGLEIKNEATDGGLAWGDIIVVDGEDRGYRPIRDLIGVELVDELYHLNDGIPWLSVVDIARHTFAEIADIIEERF